MCDTFLLVDIDKIKYNLHKLRSLDKDAMFAGVVKANAYGLGAVTICKEIEDEVDYFAVARFDEAYELRNSGIIKPILILGYVCPNDAIKCAKLNIEIPVYDLGLAKQINEILDRKLKVHIALDTGHGRIGFRDYEIDKIKEIKNFENLEVISAFSHFSTADEEDTSYTKLQEKKFTYIIEQTKDTFNYQFTHIANDAGAIKHGITKDMIRSGISLYGIYPSDLLKIEKDIELRQAFSLISTISFVKDVKKGQYISYGRTFRADKAMKVATISIGYADGYPRSFSNKAKVKIAGKEAQILGRVCMDQMMVDVTNINAKIGDRVQIYPDIYQAANSIDTIVYELMTNINMRVPRIYMKDGEIFKKVKYIGEMNEN
ncbi:MAG: alanine racemase [Peptoniphilaceae bacterium]|nr:alanine racemase [Peptoniphilaceae bacterium]MDY6019645.1 alanine racemase [Anaerococcus sp.]